MNEFYKRMLERVEMQNQLNKESSKRESELLEIKDERTIPKLKVKFKEQRKRKWKRR